MLNMPPYRIEIMVFVKMTACQPVGYAAHNLSDENSARNGASDD